MRRTPAEALSTAPLRLPNIPAASLATSHRFQASPGRPIPASGGMLADTVTCLWRFSRAIDAGVVPSWIVTSCSRGTTRLPVAGLRPLTVGYSRPHLPEATTVARPEPCRRVTLRPRNTSNCRGSGETAHPPEPLHRTGSFPRCRSKRVRRRQGYSAPGRCPQP